MSAAPGIWSRLTQVVVCLIVIAVLLLLAMCYLPLIRQNERFRREILRHDGLIAREEAVARQTREALEILRTDPRAVERLARERLGYARPGETVIWFEAPAPAPPPRF